MSRVALLARFLKARPYIWIDGCELEIAGRYAWRTRVSDLRRPPHAMSIENRQRRVRHPNGIAFVISEYRYVPEKGEGGCRCGEREYVPRPAVLTGATSPVCYECSTPRRGRQALMTRRNTKQASPGRGLRTS